jgi:hypothetical protein
MSSVWKIVLFSVVTGLTILGIVKLEDWDKKSTSRTWLINHRNEMARELLEIFHRYETTAAERQWVIVGINHKHESYGAFWDATSPDKRPTQINAANLLGIDCVVAYGGHIQGGQVVEWFDITPSV